MYFDTAGIGSFGPQWDRNCQLSSAVIVIIEYFLQLDNEVELFWKRPWSLAKYLFLWSRYYSLAHYFWWQIGGFIFQVMTIHCILALRLYAMFERSKTIVAVLVTVLISQVTSILLILFVNRTGTVDVFSPAPGVVLCQASLLHARRVAYIPLSVLSTECIFLSLALYRGWKSHSYGGRLLHQLTKESFLYFTAIAIIHIMATVQWMVSNSKSSLLSSTEPGIAWFLAIPAVLTNRLLISARAPMEPASDTEPFSQDTFAAAPVQFDSILGSHHLHSTTNMSITP
ncbi:hypothetical protein C8J57DRAFT_52099 [Mycena rebaudengoi]|nr:hypothetical protein C8J57DRAFT_52099 [Mycena rebaudengoi]